VGLDVLRATLPSGLEVVAVPQPHLHTACVALFVGVGSRHESRAENGLSHLLEHMLFRGTARLPSAYALNHAIESLGGTLYGATHADHTVYQVSVPPESLEEALLLFGEIATTPAFADLAIEKAIVREEILEGVDEEGRDVDVDDVARAALFGAHPLGFKITGDAETVARFGEDDLRRWHARHYVGPCAVLAVTGAVDAAHVLDRAHRAFAALPDGARTPNDTPVLEPGPRFRYVDSDGTQTELRVSFLAPGERDPDRFALDLLRRVLDDGMSTRLHRRLCDEAGLAYDVFSGLELYEDCGVFDVGATVEHAKVPRVVREVLELCAELRDTPPTDEELAKAKRRHGWDLRATLDDAAGVATFHGLRALMGLRETLDEVAARVQAMTAEQVRAVARRVFRPEHVAVTAVGWLEDAGLERDARRAALTTL
jgi:predicted Zn-dependent peptidase